MSEERLKRRLAAIVALDVAGYTRLMEENEEGTHKRLMSLMRDLVEPELRRAGGRVVKSTGDGALVEFASVIDATNCALAIQRAVGAQEAGQEPRRRLEYRIGINIGEIIVEPDEIYGDGVNIAARLQEVAEPGGICVTAAVAEQIADRVPVIMIDLGEQRLKNISRPVRVLRLLMGEPPVGAEPGASWTPARLPIIPGFDGRPAIAVLPFSNLSGDPEQEYFADGITEDIITLLAAWRSLPVIARNSVFTYKGRPVDVRTIGRELGARYVLEGSVRRQESRIRITAKLADAETNQYCFADRYDRDASSLFAVQDEIVQNIVGEVEPELLRLERERAVRSPRERLSAYDALQRGLWHHYRYTAQDNRQAQAFFRQAIALDSSWSEPPAALAIALAHSFMHGWHRDEVDRLLAEARELAHHALAAEPRNPQAHFALGLAHYHTSEIAAAMRATEEVVRLNPSHAAAHAFLGSLHNHENRPDRSLISVLTALRLSPNDPRRFLWMPALAGSYYLAGRYDEAVATGNSGLALKPDYLTTARYVVAGLGQLGRRAEAAPLLPLLRKLDGSLSGTEAYLGRYFIARAALDLIIDGLRKAGFE